MQDFSYVSAQTLSEAVALLDENGEKARILAGGTDLIVNVREGRRDVDLMIDVKSIPEVNVLDYDANTGLTLGAAVECYKIYAVDAICRCLSRFNRCNQNYWWHRHPRTRWRWW